MSEITQRLGFETSQAVAALNNLNNALKPVNTSLRNFNKAANANAGKKVISNLGDLQKKADTAKKSVKALGTELQTTGKQGAAGIQKINIGLGGLAKALVAREVVQLLNNIKTAILDTADAAAEFELSVARISNIAQGPGSSIAELTDSLEELSVQLGRPIGEVTEAAFEALQNDLGNTAETMNLLATAADNLALITDGTLTQSINSISSVLKSYNLDISEAGKITDIFFAAIDKGRITLSELESSLGKITPLAARLDIDFTQVAAAMAAITQSGTSAAVANTQLRSILQKLIQPTEALQGAFTKLGVTTFNDLINRSGSLQVALQQIAGALNNDERAIASAFGRLRAQLGVFNLLANEGKIFSDTLDAVTDSTGKAAAAADVLRDTDAFRQQQAAEKFNQTMREIGESILETKTAFLEFANETLPAGDTIVAIIGKIAAVAVAGIGTGLVVALTAATAATAALAAGVLALGLAVAAGFALGEALQFDVFAAESAKFLVELDKINEAITNDTSEAILKSNAAIENALNQRGDTFESYVTGLSAAFEKETAAIREATALAEQALTDSFATFRQGLKDVFSDIESQVKGFDKAMKTAKKSVRDTQKVLDDLEFDAEGETLSKAQQFNRIIDRAEDEAADLAKALRDSKLSPENAEIAEELAENLQKASAAQKKEADSIGNAFNKRKLLAVATENELLAARALNTLAKDREASLQAQIDIGDVAIAAEGNKLTKLDEQSVILEAQLKTLGKINPLTNPKGFKDAAANAQATLDNVKELRKELDASVFENFDSDDKVKKLFDAVNESISQAEFDFTKIREDMQAKLSEGEFKIFVDILSNLPEFEGALGDVIQDIQNAADNPVQATEKIRDTLEGELKKNQESNKNLVGATAKVLASNETTSGLVANALTDTAEANKGFVEAFQTEIEAIQEQLLRGDLTQEEIAGLEGRLATLAGKIQQVIVANGGDLANNVGKALQDAIDAALQAVDAKENAIKFAAEFDKEEFDKVVEAIGIIDAQLKTQQETQEAVTKAVGGTTAAQVVLDTQIKVVIGTTKLAVTQMNALKAAAEAAAKAIRDANTAAANSHHGGVPLRKSGGVAFRAHGGRGLDTQPAMLSRGEFVMNARSARRFFPQMSAMNAGQEPSFRDQGGSVTNIGDVNVNITGSAGSENPEQAGRQIANSLRRELRRKTSTL